MIANLINYIKCAIVSHKCKNDDWFQTLKNGNKDGYFEKVSNKVLYKSILFGSKFNHNLHDVYIYSTQTGTIVFEYRNPKNLEAHPQYEIEVFEDRYEFWGGTDYEIYEEQIFKDVDSAITEFTYFCNKTVHKIPSDLI